MEQNLPARLGTGGAREADRLVATDQVTKPPRSFCRTTP